MSKTLTVCVTGAAGQIAYSFFPQLLRGACFPGVRIRLRLLDIPQAEKVMQGVILELHDCNYKLLESVESGSDATKMFQNADVIVFIGGFPRKPGMERKDLLNMNKKIFVEQSKALSVASKDVRCVVVANPANTNAYILSYFNPDIKKENITCLTRLDHNRAVSQIKNKVNCGIDDISGVVVFGNHSLTQYPSINNITVKGKSIQKQVDKQWLQKTFISNVQKRGGQILKVRGGSSVFSAASAVIDHLRDWYCGTEEVVSMGVVSNGEYGIPKGLWSSFPVRTNNFRYQIVAGVELSSFCRQKIKVTVDQLDQQVTMAQVPRAKL